MKLKVAVDNVPVELEVVNVGPASLEKVDQIVAYLYGLSLDNLKAIACYYQYAIKIYKIDRRCFYYLFIY
mgnify:CR=1 FL=1